MIHSHTAVVQWSKLNSAAAVVVAAVVDARQQQMGVKSNDAAEVNCIRLFRHLVNLFLVCVHVCRRICTYTTCVFADVLPPASFLFHFLY